jgi:TldD protein
MTESKVKIAVKRAVEIAKASKLAGGERVELSPIEPIVAEWSSQYAINPFEVPLEEKLDILYEATDRMKSVPQVLLREGYMTFWEEEKIYASSEGALIKQFLIHSGGGISATAVSDAGEVQVRTFPSSFRGDFALRGFEFVKNMPLKAKAQDIAQEAALLLKAPLCPEGEMDVILGESQLALQVHESCGHPVELDRVLGMEANYAGTSFMVPELLGNLQYGSEKVNIVADSTVSEGLGSFGYDDEGVPAQKTPIIKNGIFVGYLTSRETAPKLGQKSNGTMRAMDWNNIPIIRMTNINLLPGKADLGDIISSTEKGILLKQY